MKNIFKTVYPYLLFFYSLVIIFVILLGSHGGFYIDNSETQLGIIIVLVFVTTGILFLKKGGRGEISSMNVKVFKALNILTVILLTWQVILLYPFEITFYSSAFWGIHLFGLVCGIFLTFQLFKKF